MGYRLAADLTLLLHLLFVLFVVFGGLLCLHRWRWALLHLPAVLWGIWIEWSGRICPLTPLENHFRRLAGDDGYSGGFIEHYLLPVLYPANLDRPLQWLLGALALLINLAVYAWLLRRRKTGHGAS